MHEPKRRKSCDLSSRFHREFFKVHQFYWPTNELNCIKLKRLKSTCITVDFNILSFIQLSALVGQSK